MPQYIRDWERGTLYTAEVDDGGVILKHKWFFHRVPVYMEIGDSSWFRQGNIKRVSIEAFAEQVGAEIISLLAVGGGICKTCTVGDIN